jgi:hypothetical protein
MIEVDCSTLLFESSEHCPTMLQSCYEWLTEGIPLLKLKDHLDERAQDKATMEEQP